MQWTKKGERPPKKFKVQKSVSKLMATIFWDSEGVLLIDYLPNGTTMNGQYYANLLAQTREAVVQKRRGKLSRGVLFLQDNASVHTARVSSITKPLFDRCPLCSCPTRELFRTRSQMPRLVHLDPPRLALASPHQINTTRRGGFSSEHVVLRAITAPFTTAARFGNLLPSNGFLI
ncbi:hypothetical protein EVAR_92294_1 [Eumeta japonica]|uniref:Mariner Mos1 transposase n=1 Tax=Eumeta variegata TaxID=151549 RepID=A0A4C1TLC7_EUMVA|nr:hypothetical protein EVAR_92294_1 [Eumeta japonica]